MCAVEAEYSPSPVSRHLDALGVTISKGIMRCMIRPDEACPRMAINSQIARAKKLGKTKPDR